MKCSNCKKESTWLELIGQEFICHKCIQKHKLMGNLLRTNQKSFSIALKKLKINNYEELMNISKEQIENIIPMKSILRK